MKQNLSFPNIFRTALPTLSLAALLLCSGPAMAADSYFDVNGSTAGSGVVGSTTYSTWTGSSFWSTSSDGDVATSTWTSDDDAIFSAGTDADALGYTISLSAGTTVVNSISKNGSGNVAVSGASGYTISLTSGTFNVAGGNLSMNVVVTGTSGITKNGAGGLSFGAGAATYTGDTVVNAGTLSMTVARQPTTSRLVLNNSGIYRTFIGNNTVAGISGTSTSTFVESAGSIGTITTSKASGEESYAGTIRDSGVALSIVKDGAFTQRFSGDNIYTGTTSVIAGTLLINGDTSSATGAVTVGAAGTLGGTGTVGGATTVEAGGSLAAGDSSRATLTFENGLDISAVDGTPSLLFGLGATGDSDEIAAIVLTIGTGVLGFDDFSFTAETGFGNGVYTLFSSIGITGTLDGSDLTGLVGGLDATLSISSNNILLTVVPEPSTAGLLLLGLVFGMGARRRFSVALR